MRKLINERNKEKVEIGVIKILRGCEVRDDPPSVSCDTRETHERVKQGNIEREPTHLWPPSSVGQLGGGDRGRQSTLLKAYLPQQPTQ